MDKKVTHKKVTHVFFYGSLLSGLWNNVWLRKAKFIGKAKTDKSYWLLTHHPRGQIPMLAAYFPSELRVHGEKPAATPIIGEVWELNDKVLAEVDRLENHPYTYSRDSLIPVTLDDGTKMKVSVYFGVRWSGYCGEDVIVIPNGDYRAYMQDHPVYKEYVNNLL